MRLHTTCKGGFKCIFGSPSLTSYYAEMLSFKECGIRALEVAKHRQCRNLQLSRKTRMSIARSEYWKRYLFYNLVSLDILFGIKTIHHNNVQDEVPLCDCQRHNSRNNGDVGCSEDCHNFIVSSKTADILWYCRGFLGLSRVFSTALSNGRKLWQSKVSAAWVRQRDCKGLWTWQRLGAVQQGYNWKGAVHMGIFRWNNWRRDLY